MNRLSALVLAGWVVALAVPAAATPLYYTFSGEVTRVFDPQGQVAGLQPGSPVTYTLLVDFLGEGSATQGGSTIVYEDVTNGYYDGILRYSADYFRVDYVSGDAIILPGTGSSYRENMGMALSIWDSLDTSYIYYYGYLNASIQTEFYNLLNLGKVEFQDPSAHPQNWVIGTSVDSFERIIAPGGYVEVQSSLTLDRISLSAPAAVPEPRSWVLVGSGLLIMGASAFRRS